jgi:hypothetical protein
MKTTRLAPALLGTLLLAGCAAATPAVGPPPGTVTARVASIDVKEGVMFVEWDGGQTYLTMDRRALGSYRPGDTVVLDRWLRPLGRG